MNTQKSIEILEALASGYDPISGKAIDQESIFSQRDVICALQVAIDALKPKVSEKNPKTKNPAKEIDFFRKEKFCKLTSEMISELQVKVDELGIHKSENLPEYMRNARLKYPRAYEPWSAAERLLFENAIKLTNDLDLLSECFQRGKGSIESYGQKLLYERQNKEMA